MKIERGQYIVFIVMSTLLKLSAIYSTLTKMVGLEIMTICIGYQLLKYRTKEDNMSRYELIDHVTKEHHQLDFENVGDIMAALREIKAFNAKEWPYKFEEDRKRINTWECFDETIEKMSHIKLPITDY
jgi:hypothetical protein